MFADPQAAKRIPGYCALCISRCGSIAVVENGRFVALEPDPSHPTGHALCAKGRAAPELVYHPDRRLYPLNRTRLPLSDPPRGLSVPAVERASAAVLAPGEGSIFVTGEVRSRLAGTVWETRLEAVAIRSALPRLAKIQIYRLGKAESDSDCS